LALFIAAVVFGTRIAIVACGIGLWDGIAHTPHFAHPYDTWIIGFTFTVCLAVGGAVSFSGVRGTRTTTCKQQDY